jgi:O-acetyl-ADP-ribose deacetylase (regulator of RNase III)
MGGTGREVPLSMKHDGRPNLSVIQGAYPRRIPHGSMEIVAAPERLAPFSVDAVVMEEDTFCVLGADRAVQDSEEPLMKIKTRLLETAPKPTGSVVVRNGRPLRLLAIVHDFNRDPSWREEWIAQAMWASLTEADERQLDSLAFPFLGAVYGRLGRRRVLELLRAALDRFTPRHLKRLWVVVPGGTDPGLLDLLKVSKPGAAPVV